MAGPSSVPVFERFFRSVAQLKVDKSDVKRFAIAALLGAALDSRAEKVDLVAFSDTTAVIPIRKNQSVLLTVTELGNSIPHSGTQTWQAVRRPPPT
jgi:hypothetical protein